MRHMAQPYTLQHEVSAFIYIYIYIDDEIHMYL